MTSIMNIETPDAEPSAPPSREPTPAARLRPAVWVGIAVTAVLTGYVVLNRGPAPPDRPAPVPSSSSVPGPHPAGDPAPAAGPNQRQYLSVTTICAPVTDGRHTLAVSFEVSDVSDYPVQLNAVDGVLPGGGLRQHGPATRGGDCRDDGALPVADTVLPGESRFYTLTFDLPQRCPARYPIQVRVGFVAEGFTETSLSLLYSDLSVPDFDRCGRS